MGQVSGFSNGGVSKSGSAGGGYQAPSFNTSQSSGKGGGSAPTTGKGGGGAPQQAADAVYNRYKSQLDPRFDREQNAMQANLANQGFMTNSAGYNDAMGQFSQNKNLAYQDAADAAINTGFNQYNTMRGQSLQEELGRGGLDYQRKMGAAGLGLQNRAQGFSEEMGRGQLDLSRVLGLGNLELQNQGMQNQTYQQELSNMLAMQNAPINQLMQLSGLIPMPQFSPQYNVPVAGPAAQQYNGKMNAWNNENANNQASMGSLAGLFGTAMMAFSSHDYKENKRTPEPVLDRLNRLVIEDWNYKPEMGLGQGTHTGPYAEDWAREFGGSGREISVISMMGVMMKAIQELTAKVDGAEAS